MKTILLLILIINSYIIFAESNNGLELFVNPEDEIDFSSCAIATFVNILDDTDVLGAVSLGRSLKYVKTQISMHVITYQSSKFNYRSGFLKNNGWNIFDSADILDKESTKNNYADLDTPTKEKLSKFAAYMLLDYDMVIYLENDVIVSENIDELCRCKHAKLGGVPYVKKHNVGAMTLVPSEETFKTIINSHEDSNIAVPYDFFEYFYKLQECPYYDPLLEKYESVPSHECIRLPVRYNGDVVYQMLSGWIDNQLDRPKILHYSLSLMKPWSWWSSIFLPQYWLWSSSYLDALRDSEVMLGSSMVLWCIATFSVLLIFYCFSYTKRFLSITTFGFLYANPTRLLHMRLFIFHTLNLFFLLFSIQYSNIYLTHPFLNIVLFSLTLTGLSDIILFNHMPQSYGVYRKFLYLICSVIFFSLFLNTWLISVDFLSRIIAISFWFITVHAIIFTSCFLSINNHRRALLNRIPHSVDGSHITSDDDDKNPLVALINSIPNPRDIISQWK